MSQPCSIAALKRSHAACCSAVRTRRLLIGDMRMTGLPLRMVTISSLASIARTPPLVIILAMGEMPHIRSAVQSRQARYCPADTPKDGTL
jgi:hypothetical protein